MILKSIDFVKCDKSKNDEYIRLDTTIICIDNLISKASSVEEANALFKAKDAIYNQERYTEWGEIMTEKKAIKAAMRLKKYCKNFEYCRKSCVFRDLEKYPNSGCMLREGKPPDEYDEMTEGGEENGRAKEE